MDNDQVIAVNEEQAANGEAAAAEAPKKATRTRRKAVPKAKEAGTDSASALPDLQQPAVDGRNAWHVSGVLLIGCSLPRL